MLGKRHILGKVVGRKIPTAYRRAAVRRAGDTVRRNGGLATQLRYLGLGLG